MRSLRGIIIAGAIVAGTLVLAIAIGVVWLNSFIHSPAFKAEIESQASSAIGGPVQIKSIDFGIFHGVQMEGLVTQLDANHSGGQGALTVEIARVNCSCSWAELLTRRLRLTGVTLEKPQIILTKQATAPLAAPALATVNATTPSGPIGGTVPGPGGSAIPFQLILDRAKINNGSVSVRDATGASMVELHGISGTAKTVGFYEGKDVTGSLKIASATASRVEATDFSAELTYHPGLLEANPFKASTLGGEIAGDYTLGNGTTSVLNLNARQLNVAQLTAATISNSQAKLSGSLDVQSKWRGIESGELNGEGDAQLTKGKIEGVKILEEVSHALKIKELDAPVITKAQTHFLVQNRVTKFIGLQVESPLFKITGDGTVDFAGNLNANLVLVLTRDAMGRLPKPIAGSFVQQQDGTGSIAFQVTGTASDPKTDLAMRLLMQNVQIKKAINKALDKFFH